MKVRIETGTDVAMLGVWDASRSTLPLDEKGFAGIAEMLEQDSADGHLFLIHTGADGGGPVDVYVDEEPPGKVLKGAKSITDRDYLLRVPGGRVAVGGAEDYRARQPINTSEKSIVELPAGDYALRCWSGPEESEGSSASEKEIHKAVGKENVRYFDRMNNIGCAASALVLLLFPVLTIWLRWWMALPITFLAWLGYFGAMQWVLTRIPRYRALQAVIPAMRQAAAEPDFIFVLKRAEPPHELRGGSVQLT